MSALEHRVLHGSTLRVRSGSATHVGRVRDHNEDSLIARGMVFAVADGMGGHAAGEVASHLAIEALETLAEQPPAQTEDLVRVLREANRRILESQAQSPEQRGMGTTIAGLTVVDAGGREHWVVFNIGDSRVYRLADNRMSLVTRDHSEVRELMDAGLIDADEASRHPMRNVITRSLGSDPAPSPTSGCCPRPRASGSSCAVTGCPASSTTARSCSSPASTPTRRSPPTSWLPPRCGPGGATTSPWWWCRSTPRPGLPARTPTTPTRRRAGGCPAADPADRGSSR